MKSFKTYFWDVIINQYADFNGVATRKQFWLFSLFHFIIFLLILLILVLLWGPFAFYGAGSGSFTETSYLFSISFIILFFLIYIALLVPSIAMSVRRLHDINYSGWYLLIGLIPYVGGLALFVFYLLPSEINNNEYRPKQ